MTPTSFSLRLQNLNYAANEQSILRDVNITVSQAEGLLVTGYSGQGKSTLIKLLAGLARPTSGQIFYNDIEINTLPINELTAFRRKFLGLATQNPHIVPSLSVLDNLELAIAIHNPKSSQRSNQAMRMLETFEIAHKARDFAATLSGGEARRVALARAFVNKPPIVLLDEPLAGLDEELSLRVSEAILALKAQTSALLVISTHNLHIAPAASKRLHLGPQATHE